MRQDRWGLLQNCFQDTQTFKKQERSRSEENTEPDQRRKFVQGNWSGLSSKLSLRVALNRSGDPEWHRYPGLRLHSRFSVLSKYWRSVLEKLGLSLGPDGTRGRDAMELIRSCFFSSLLYIVCCLKNSLYRPYFWLTVHWTIPTERGRTSGSTKLCFNFSFALAPATPLNVTKMWLIMAKGRYF